MMGVSGAYFMPEVAEVASQRQQALSRGSVWLAQRAPADLPAAAALLYFELQVQNMCGVHALNMLLGWQAVTCDQMLQFRQLARPQEAVVFANDIPLWPLEAADLVHHDEGFFNGTILAAWLNQHAGATLLPVAPNEAAAHNLNPPENDPSVPLAPILTAWALRHGVSAFLVSTPGHAMVLRFFQGLWWLLDSANPLRGPSPLTLFNHPALRPGLIQYMYVSPIEGAAWAGRVPVLTMGAPVLPPPPAQTAPPPHLPLPTGLVSFSVPTYTSAPLLSLQAPAPLPLPPPRPLPLPPSPPPPNPPPPTLPLPLPSPPAPSGTTPRSPPSAAPPSVAARRVRARTESSPAPPSPAGTSHVSPLPPGSSPPPAAAPRGRRRASPAPPPHPSTSEAPSPPAHRCPARRPARPTASPADDDAIMLPLPPPAASPAGPPSQPRRRTTRLQTPHQARNIVGLPDMRTWLWAVFDDLQGSYWGLVLAHLDCSDRGQRVARVVWCDGEWSDYTLSALRDIHAHRVPSSVVPAPYRLAVRATLQQMADGTYADPHDAGLYQELNVAADFADWSMADWEALGLAPLDPAPMDTDAAPAALPVPSAPAPPPSPSAPAAFLSRAHGAGARPRVVDSAPGLRIATHNVAGLTSIDRAFRLVRAWHAANLDIVCLQETWAGRPSRNCPARPPAELEQWLYAACQACGCPPYAITWASNTAVADQGNGVALLVRQSQHLHVSGATASSACGRLLRVTVAWAGHNFTLVNAYWPAESAAARSVFLDALLRPALPDGPVVVVGDFNFTADPALDRYPVASSTAAADASCQTAWVVAAPGLLDVYRARHPLARSFTFHRAGAAARLDRAYVSPTLLPHVLHAGVMFSPVGDHHAASLLLLPAHPLPARGPGRVRVDPSIVNDDSAHLHLVEYMNKAVAYGLSLAHEDVIDWWGGMKSHLQKLARTLVRQRAAQRSATEQRAAVALDRLRAATEAVASATLPDLQPAIAAHTQAAAAYQSAARAVSTAASSQARCRWLHDNERPCPFLTHQVHPPPRPTRIAALRAADGALLTSNASIATRLVQHFASVSAQPATDPAARARVLAALRADIHTGLANLIPADLAHAAGEAPFTAAEVWTALQAAAPDTSPGPDGLPVAVWASEGWAALLAHLFNACFACNRFPAGFLDGTISPLFKDGAPDVTQAPAFRPITLLNCDYRVLAACLATRFGVALAPAIGPEQSAFLPGRRIEDSILFSSLLPHVAHVMGVPLALISLDIAKAYDTVCRQFLFAVLEELGASPGMLRWARLVLSDTWASVHVNGVESPKLQWHAGVRQGCPLAPLLYNCVAQALTSWLRAQPDLGIVVRDVRHVSNHYADDSKVCAVLTAPVPAALHQPLQEFHRATNQASNIPKSVATLGGPAPAPPPADLAGVPVREAAISLGVVVYNPPPPPPRLPSSHHTRSQSRPAPAAPASPRPALFLTTAQRRVQTALACQARVTRMHLSDIGRGLAASTYVLSTALYYAEFNGLCPALLHLAATVAREVAPGVPVDVLYGPPSTGGFGLLPFQAHVQARHAAMACRLARHLLQPADGWPAWVRFASFLLERACPHLHPVQTLLAASCSTPDLVRRGDVGLPPGMQLTCLPPGVLTDMVVALQMVGPLQPLLPTLPPAAQVLSTPAVSRDDLVADLRHLAWRVPDPAAVVEQPQPLVPAAAAVPVKALTALISSPSAARRARLHAVYLQLALGEVPSPAQCQAFRSVFRSIWRIPCANHLKCTLWRLAVDAIPGSRVRPWHCPCDLHRPHPSSRLHSFWDCPVARAVRDQLQRALGATPLARHEVWLATHHSPDIHIPVWRLVACLALDAMDYGRRLLWIRRRSAAWPDPGPAGLAALRTTLTAATVDAQVMPAILAARHDVVAAVANLAAARFWHNLHDFASAHRVAPPARFDAVRADHPFLAVRDGTLHAQLPREFLNQ
jgi:endonuclease/exonuclease/phosphatase family metal-dependent hydrolase